MTQLALQPSPPPVVLGRPTLESWLRAQAVNVQRHLDALRPFAEGEFGTDAASPTPGASLRPLVTTRAPSATSSFAVSSPIPPVDPVTRHAFPVSPSSMGG